MTSWRERLAFVLGRKSLYDLYPELAVRIPILRSMDSESSGAAPLGAMAQQDYAVHVWMHKAISIIAENLAPLRLYIVDAEGEKVEKHSITELFEYVNPSMCSADLWQQWAIDMLLHGEHGQEFSKTRGKQYAEVWPRTSASFSVKIDKAKRNYGGVVGYHIDGAGAGTGYDLAIDEFVHYKFYNPENQFRGLAPSRAAALSVLLDQYAARSQLNFFKHGMRPDYAVFSEQGLTPREKTEITAGLEERHRGPEREFAPIVLEGPIKDVKPLGFPPKDAEWVTLREMTREEIGALYGVPDEIMGWGRDTYENFRMAWKVFWLLTLVPMIRLRDNTLTEFFLTTALLQPGQRVETDLSQVDALQEDKSDKISAGVQLWQAGVPWSNVDELLGLGLGDFPGKEQAYLPLSIMPVSGGKAIQTVTIKAIPPPAHFARESEAHKALWLLFKAGTETRERGLARIIKKSFQREQREVSKQVQDGKTEIGEIYHREASRKAWLREVKPYWIETVIAGGKHGAEQLKEFGKQQIGIDFDVTNPIIAAAIDKMLWDFTDEITETTQEKLKALLKKAADEGTSIPDVMEELAELYQGFIDYRAERIARTETIKAYNFGTLEQYKAEGVKRKGWLSALDERTRQPPESEFNHWDAHGEEVDINDTFERTGEKLMFPGDPSGSPGNIINCRCTEYPIVEA